MVPTPTGNGLFSYYTSSIQNSSCAERSALLEMRATLQCSEPNEVSNAMQHSRSADAVIRVYDEAGNVIETHEHKGEFKELEFSLA